MTQVEWPNETVAIIPLESPLNNSQTEWLQDKAAKLGFTQLEVTEGAVTLTLPAARVGGYAVMGLGFMAVPASHRAAAGDQSAEPAPQWSYKRIRAKLQPIYQALVDWRVASSIHDARYSVTALLG